MKTRTRKVELMLGVLMAVLTVVLVSFAFALFSTPDIRLLEMAIVSITAPILLAVLPFLTLAYGSYIWIAIPTFGFFILVIRFTYRRFYGVRLRFVTWCIGCSWFVFGAWIATRPELY